VDDYRLERIAELLERIAGLSPQPDLPRKGDATS